MNVETSVLITVITLLVGIGIWLGKLWSDVKHNRKDIEDNKKGFNNSIDSLRRENREDHALLFKKFEDLNNYVRNGRGND